MKNLFISILLISCNSFAQELIPLNGWAKKNPKWSSQPSELTYMLGRCASALLTMSGYIKANSQDNTDLLKTSEILSERGASFGALSINVGISNGASEEFLMNRIAQITKLYTDSIIKNKTIHNDAFTGDFQSDITFCTTFYPLIFNEKLGYSIAK